MKTIIIAVAAAALIAAASTAIAAQQHKTRHHSALSGYSSERGMEAARARAGYPNAFGYAPVQSQHLDREIESSRQAGGGGGGGGGGGSGM